MIEIFIVIKDGTNQYYLLKVQRRGFDVYCFPPHLGVHYSLPESGEAHFQPDALFDSVCLVLPHLEPE